MTNDDIVWRVDGDTRESVRQGAADLLSIVSERDTHEQLAALYAAAQVVERELLLAGVTTLTTLAAVQAIGRRTGATLHVDIEHEEKGPNLH